MSLDRLLAIVSSLCIGLVLLLGGWLMISDQQALLTDARQREIDQSSVVFATTMDQAATLSATHAESLAADSKIRSLLASGARSELQAYAKPMFDRLSRLAGVGVVHFHDAAMKSFLRVWEPQNFGQDLSTFRPMVVAANHDRQTQKGLELGVRGLSLRAVSPVFAANGSDFVGTVEVGVDLQALADLAKAASGSDFALVLDRRFLRESTSGAASTHGLMLDAATDRTLFEGIMTAGRVQLSRSDVMFFHRSGDRNLTVQGRPLIDYSGNMIGTILTVSDFSSLETYYNRTLVTIGSVFLGGLLIVLAIFMSTVRAAVIRPLNDLTARLKAAPGDIAALPPASGLKEFRNLHGAVKAAVSAGPIVDPDAGSGQAQER